MQISRAGGAAFIAITLAMMLQTASAIAADTTDKFDLSPEQLLNAVVVSVSKTSEKVMAAPAAIYVLTNEDIMRSGATSIPDALRLVPGVQVARVNADAWAVSVRGFNNSLDNKLLVLIDGREIYDPLYSGVYWDVQDVVLEDIDRIEVVRGPGGTLWGANAVNGIINIITKKAADTQGNLVSATVGKEDRGIVEERYGGKFSDNGYYRIYGKYLNRADEPALAGGDAHDGQAMERGGFRADWKGASSFDDFTMQGDAYQSNDSNLIALPNVVAPFERTQVNNVTAYGANILGKWDRSFSEDSKFSLKTYLDYTQRNQLIINDERATFDVDAQYELPSRGAHKIVVGGGYRYSLDQTTSSPYASLSSYGDSTNIFNGFVQDKITLDPGKWYLTLGTKLEHNDFTGFEVSPNVRLQYRPDDEQMVWAAVSRAVRTPSLVNRDASVDIAVLPLGGVPAQLLLKPNSNYGSEDVIAYELGYRNQLTPSFSLDVASFFNDYSHLETVSFLTPNLGTIPYQFPLNYTNDTHGNTYGIETVFDWKVLDRWKLSASYSALEMDLKGPPSNLAIGSESASQQSPNEQFDVRSLWNAGKNVTFDTTLFYVAALPGLQVPEYWRLDAHMGWRITDGLQFNLVGQDLLNTEQREFSNLTDVNAINLGPTVYGNLTWRF